jgi:hypothetical protein
MRLAESACSSTGFRSVFFIGTLAAAYAEAGRFEDAVKTAEKACALAEESGAPALLKKNRELLELYRAGHAYREPLQTNKAGRVTTPRNQDGLQKP